MKIDQQMSDRVAILLALKDEQSRADPSEAVIATCEWALRSMPDLSERCAMYIEMSQPSERD